jgi:acetyl esterase
MSHSLVNSSASRAARDQGVHSDTRAPDHSGLPPALIQVAEHDPLRAGGERYAAALRAAKVPVRFTEYVGVPHGFVNFPGLTRAAHQAMAEVCAEQSQALAAAIMPRTQRP